VVTTTRSKLLRAGWSRAPLAAIFAILFGLLLAGCVTTPKPAAERAFNFQTDTFAYPNELVWEYFYDAKGKWTSQSRQPKPTYSHHCFVVAKTAHQFFRNVRFDPRQPVADEQTYRRLIRKVVATNPRQSLPASEKIVIPGYPHLRAFSAAQEKVLKAECGGAWQSYFQRGHWRMIFPFGRESQQEMAEQMARRLATGEPLVIHLVCFPELTINHAMVLYEARESEGHLQFEAYDPNQPEKPVQLTFDRTFQSFFLAANNYYPGGLLDVYQVYHRWNY
jgi:hypothetical protein